MNGKINLHSHTFIVRGRLQVGSPILSEHLKEIKLVNLETPPEKKRETKINFSSRPL